MFDPNSGEFLSCFGIAGCENGELSSPRGLSTDNDGHLVVCDTFNDRIQVFTMSGIWIKKFGEKGTGPGQLGNPTSVSVAANTGNIIVCETSNHRVQIFDPLGYSIMMFGGQGTGQGLFNNPFGVITDRNGRIVVGDQNNRRIQIFSNSGEFLKDVLYPDRGGGDQDIVVSHKSPTLSKEGNIIITDRHHELLVFG